MNTRQSREEQHRLVLGVGFVVSLALHGVLLGALTLPGPELAGEVPDRSAETPVFLMPSTELVQIQEPPEQVFLDPVITDAPRILTAPTSEEVTEPKSGDAILAASGETAASAAGAAGGAELADDPIPVALASAETGTPSALPLSMRPRFGIQQKMLESTRKPIEALDPLAYQDHAEGEGEEEESWWRRLGAKFGIGDGGKICVPRPEVIDKSAEVLEK